MLWRMTMRHCWARLIRVRSLKFGLVAAAIAAIAFVCLGAGDPMVELKAGASALDAKRYPPPSPTLSPLLKRIPKLADYAAGSCSHRAVRIAELRRGSQDAGHRVEAIAGIAAGARARCCWPRRPICQNNDGERCGRSSAQELFDAAAARRRSGDGRCIRGAGDQVSAAVYNQRVYYTDSRCRPKPRKPKRNWPDSARELGDNVSARDAQRDARPRVEAARCRARPARATQGARNRWCRSLAAPSATSRACASVSPITMPKENSARPEISRVARSLCARRRCRAPVLTSCLCARRLKNQEEVHAGARSSSRVSIRNSKWRLEALARRRELASDREQSRSRMSRCIAPATNRSPTIRRPPTCHWKVAWGHYLRRAVRRGGDAARASAHVPRIGKRRGGAVFPRPPGRSVRTIAARPRTPTTTKSSREYPNYYYTVLARDRAEARRPRAASPAVKEFLRSDRVPAALPYPRLRAQRRPRKPASSARTCWSPPGSKTGPKSSCATARKTKISRRCWPSSWRRSPTAAPAPIRPCATSSVTPAAICSCRSNPRRSISGSSPSPCPIARDLERFAKQNDMDPFLIAALIRQESEFNPKAVSRANARGLTQILPSTGRELSRRLKVQTYTTAALFQPAVNLQLGTFYLKIH